MIAKLLGALKNKETRKPLDEQKIKEFADHLGKLDELEKTNLKGSNIGGGSEKGEKFEHLLRNLFEAMGYSIELTVRTDGVDFFIKNDNEHYAVQAKNYSMLGTNMVGKEIVTKLLADIYNLRSVKPGLLGMIVTTHFFTPEARRLGDNANMVLYDRIDLIELFSELDAKIVMEAYINETVMNKLGRCQKCGAVTVFRQGKKGKFKSCSNFPECQ